MNLQIDLSNRARSLWGKSDYGVGESWLPLYIHMLDSLGVASRLWDLWLPDGTKTMIARPFGGDAKLARKACLVLAGVHDIGKATPIFQSTPSYFNGGFSQSLSWKPEHAGLYVRPDLAEKRTPSHPLAGEAILERYLEGIGWSKKVRESYASIVGAHHGVFPQQGPLQKARDSSLAELGLSGNGAEGWGSVQAELIECMMSVSEMGEGDLKALGSHVLPAPVASVVNGLVIMSDWIASNEDFFPQVSLYADEDDGVEDDLPAFVERRLNEAWSDLKLPAPWTGARVPEHKGGRLMFERFDLPINAVIRPVQSESLDIAANVSVPGLMIIEAPMGEGKTEAALAAAEIMAVRSGRGGVCVALPTMATTDAMFARVHCWIEKLPHSGLPDKSIFLAHGKAQLNEEFEGIVRHSRSARYNVTSVSESNDGSRKWSGSTINRASDEAFASDWMFGRKKGMLANFVVCTVDQVLMGALDMKHLSLRHASIVNKVVIIDECHAYDVYMQQYLMRVLEWLGYWNTPVILLSATLPQPQRDAMVDAYLKGSRAPKELRSRSMVEQERLSAGRRPSWIEKILLDERHVSDSEEKEEGADCAPVDAYPLITYTDGARHGWSECDSSGRRTNVTLSFVSAEDQSVLDILQNLLSDGGCAGVICDTVSRAQRVAESLEQAFGVDAVILDHSRFVDIDRMSIERKIRDLLGANATRENGLRPRLLVVVGTQVLEQSLDIDFDVLVTDVAPIDLLLQRLGRMHRHVRGEGEVSRPRKLRTPHCVVSGIEKWEGGIPLFSRGISSVYDEATLLETLVMLNINHESLQTSISLPEDIARLVRVAYSDAVRQAIPVEWRDYYESACAHREATRSEKVERANQCRLQSAAEACKNCRSLSGLAGTHTLRDASHDVDAGQRAVRDTQETVEVLVVRRTGDGLALLPWIGDEQRGVAKGSSIPINIEPDASIARVVSQSAVRLPMSLCAPQRIEDLLDELESGCARYVAAWQDSPWLAGRLVLPLEEDGDGMFAATLLDQRVVYTVQGGFATI